MKIEIHYNSSGGYPLWEVFDGCRYLGYIDSDEEFYFVNAQLKLAQQALVLVTILGLLNEKPLTKENYPSCTY